MRRMSIEEAAVSQAIEYLTAETDEGRRAIEEVMERSYRVDVSDVPPQWAIVRVVDGVPVSYILVDPNRKMPILSGNLRYASRSPRRQSKLAST